MADANHISFRFGGREEQSDGSGYGISVKLLKSDWEALKGSDFATLRQKYGDANDVIKANELLRLMHTIRATKYADSTQHVGFDYTLDFPLERGYGFPYILGHDYLV